MKSNNEIVNEFIINNQKVLDAFRKLTAGSAFKDDLFQEICMIFLTYDNETLNEIVTKGENDFRYFFVGIVQRQTKSNTSDFHYKFRKPILDTTRVEDSYTDYYMYVNDHFNELSVEETFNECDSLECKVIAAYDEFKHNLTWYHQHLFEFYLETGAKKGSYIEMEEATGIPSESIGKDIRAIKKWLKGHIEHKINKNGN